MGAVRADGEQALDLPSGNPAVRAPYGELPYLPLGNTHRRAHVARHGMDRNGKASSHPRCLLHFYRGYRKAANRAPGDAVLEGLEKDAREDKKGLWPDPLPVRVPSASANMQFTN